MSATADKSVFSFGTTGIVQGDGATPVAAGSFVIPKGAKAVITSAILGSGGTKNAAGIQASVAATGGLTATVLEQTVGISSTIGTSLQSASGGPISQVIDASSDAVTLTGTVIANAADYVSWTVVGKFIS